MHFYFIFLSVYRKVLEKIDLCYLEPGQIVQTKHEAKLLSQLDHPGIVKFLDSFIDGEYYCVITEYYEVCWMLVIISCHGNAYLTWDMWLVLILLPLLFPWSCEQMFFYSWCSGVVEAQHHLEMGIRYGSYFFTPWVKLKKQGVCSAS